MNNIEIQGLDSLNEKLNSLVNTEKLTQAIGKGCALVERDAKIKAPKDTGELRRSIASRVETNSDGSLEGTVYTNLEYAPYIEYGTGLFATKGGRTDVPWRYKDDKGNWHTTNGQKPQPFMGPALNQNRADIVEEIKEVLFK